MSASDVRPEADNDVPANTTAASGLDLGPQAPQTILDNLKSVPLRYFQPDTWTMADAVENLTVAWTMADAVENLTVSELAAFPLGEFYKQYYHEGVWSYEREYGAMKNAIINPVAYPHLTLPTTRIFFVSVMVACLQYGVVRSTPTDNA